MKQENAFVAFAKALLGVITSCAKKDKLPKRVVMAVIGITLTALSVALQKTIGWGVDPFSVFSFGIVELTGLSYTIIFSALCVVLLSIAFIFQRGLLGVSTLIVLFLNGYMVDFFYGITSRIWPAPGMVTKIILLIATMAIICVSAAMYYTADLGVSPYDAQALTIAARTSIPFKFARIGTDILCVVIGFTFMCVVNCPIKFEYVNFATLIFAFGMGPIIAWCRTNISEPMLAGTLGRK